GGGGARARSGTRGPAQSGPARRWRAGPGPPPESQPIPNPSTFMVPCRWRRGAHACRASPDGGPKASSCTAAGGPREARCRHIGPGSPPPAAGRRGGGVPGGAETGEDLPPDRVVPVTERAPAGHRADRERRAAQHLVLVAEEDLRVLAVGPGGKARVGQEVAGGPLPDVPHQLARR